MVETLIGFVALCVFLVLYTKAIRASERQNIISEYKESIANARDALATMQKYIHVELEEADCVLAQLQENHKNTIRLMFIKHVDIKKDNTCSSN